MKSKKHRASGSLRLDLSLIGKVIKSIKFISRLTSLFIVTTLGARLEKNYHFSNFNNLLFRILSYLKSQDFNTQMLNKKETDEIKRQADSYRYEGNQVARDLQNCILARSRLDLQEKYFLDSVPTRLLGSNFTKSFGHLAVGIGNRLRAEQLGLSQNNYVMLGNRLGNSWLVRNYYSKHIPFLFLQEEILQIIEITHDSFFEDMEVIQIRNNFYGMEVGASIIENEWNEKYPNESLLKLTEDDLDYGYSKLGEYGFHNIDWFVTFHFRNGDSERVRNVDPQTYRDSIKRLVEEGGHVFCIGENEKLEESIGKGNFFDFGTTTLKDPRFNLFLLAACRFMVGSSSGPIDVPPLFGKGVLWTNCNNLVMNRPARNSIVIPRLRTRKKRPSFEQLLTDIGQGLYENDSLPNWSNGVNIDSNTSLEIKFGVEEMLNETWKNTIEEKEKILTDTIISRAGVTSKRISKFFLDSNFS
jgi:putative glycosyltransferase (TIGR04372 family)